MTYANTDEDIFKALKIQEAYAELRKETADTKEKRLYWAGVASGLTTALKTIVGEINAKDTIINLYHMDMAEKANVKSKDKNHEQENS